MRITRPVIHSVRGSRSRNCHSARDRVALMICLIKGQKDRSCPSDGMREPLLSRSWHPTSRACSRPVPMQMARWSVIG